MAKTDTEKGFNKLFDDIDKKNPLATTLKDDNLANVSDWLSTGYYALNGIVSADLLKGIPFGRITTAFGPSQSGKSLLSALLQKSAQDKDMRVIIFDTEFDKDGRMEESFGIDTSKVKTIPVESIEQVTVQATSIFDNVIQNNLHGKVFIILDSVGALISEKEIKDIAEGKVAMDMGLKAKQFKTFLRAMKGKCAISKCPFFMINHEISNPNQLHESVFKEQGFGKAIEFFSSLMIHVDKRKKKKDDKKDADEEETLLNKGYTGQFIRCFTQKNRMCIPHKAVELYLNFSSGVEKYSYLDQYFPLIEDQLYLKSAKGEIGSGRTYYLKDGEEEIKLGAFKDWKNDDNVWQKIIPILNEKVKEEFAFKLHY